MKMNVSVEIDWLEEGQDLDQIVKEEIIAAIINKVSKTTIEKIDKEVASRFGQIVESEINTRVQELFDSFSNQVVEIRDNYGDLKKSYENVRAMVKEKFDNFMLETVDDNGKTVERGGYGGKWSRTDFLFKRHITEFADKFTKDVVAKVKEEVQATVKDGLTARLGAELMSVLKVNEMIGLPENKK